MRRSNRNDFCFFIYFFNFLILFVILCAFFYIRDEYTHMQTVLTKKKQLVINKLLTLHRASFGIDSFEIPDAGHQQFRQQRFPVEIKAIQL